MDFQVHFEICVNSKDGAKHWSISTWNTHREVSTVRFYVAQNTQNEVRYVPCCDAEEGSDTDTCDRLSYHIFH
jgi:hypothetical protein